MATRQESRGEHHAVTNAKGARLKQDRALQTRQSVLESAAAVFAEKGFPGVTILDVAEHAGLTKGAIYFHFANKEALAEAVVQEFYRRLPLIVDPALELGLSPLRTVVEALQRTATAFRDDRVIQAGARLQIERSYIGATLPAPYVDFETLLTGLLTQADEAGELRPGLSPESYARILISAFFGAQHISWVQSDRQDLKERVGEIVDAVLPGHSTAV
ncbi:ScbR family autoregulator-binding transcription factor [Streptomyces sp. NPDC054783]